MKFKVGDKVRIVRIPGIFNDGCSFYKTEEELLAKHPGILDVKTVVKVRDIHDYVCISLDNDNAFMLSEDDVVAAE
jgi:hypothetical protein